MTPKQRLREMEFLFAAWNDAAEEDREAFVEAAYQRLVEQGTPGVTSTVPTRRNQPENFPEQNQYVG